MKKNKSKSKQNSKSGASRHSGQKMPALVINPRPLIMLAVLMLVLLVIYYAQLRLRQAVDLPVNSVAITGDFHYVDRKKVAEKIEPFTHASYLSVDLQAIKNTLEQEPWIDIASVKRQWPDQVAVWIVEQQPVVQWRNDSFINASGKVFTPQKMRHIEGLPYLSGPKGSVDEVLSDWHRANEILAAQNLMAQEWQMDDKGAKSARLSNGIELVFGVGEAQSKLMRFMTIYQRQLAAQSEKIKRIDMRYTNGLAVQWQPAADKLAQQ